MRLIIYSLILILIEIFLAVLLYRQKKPGSRVYLAFVLGLLFSNLIAFFYIDGRINNPKILLLNFTLASTFSSVSMLMLLLSHLPKHYPRQHLWWLVFIVDMVVAVWVITAIDPVLVTESGTLVTPLPFMGVWGWVLFHNILQKSILWLALAVIIKNVSMRADLFSPAFFVSVAIFLPLLPGILDSELQFDVLDFQSVLFVVSALIVGLVLLWIRSNSLFFSRTFIVDTMPDGWLLINKKKEIVDLNAAAKKLLGLKRLGFSNRSAITHLAHLPTIADALKKGREVEVHTYLPPTHIQIRLLCVQCDLQHQSGYLLLVRDDTERRKLSIARQEARDEMFSLMHSIAGAASRSENISEFINSVMYQLSYSFRSTSTAIFLTEDRLSESRLLLIGQTGIDSQHLKSISFIEKKSDLVSHIKLSRESLLIRGKNRAKYLSAPLRVVLKGAVLAIPIFADDNFVGLLIMTKEQDLFRKDEIARIEIAAQQVGSFVHKDRRLYAASTIAERQRLIRDLHDSVTQRLYGLVMMTEAARVGANTGNFDFNIDFIEKLGFSARQALREMRLFLFKLKPIDMRGGLASVLLKRLEAVEGRAGLDVSVNIQEDIVMLPEDELHLYMIAQEALNNIIQHANATKVAVAYRKINSHISLEIWDNGAGFLPKDANISGIGLRSMSERAKLIGGQIEFLSSPEKGTNITVLVPEKDVVWEEIESYEY